MSHDALIAELSKKADPVHPVRMELFALRLLLLWMGIAAAIIASIGLRDDFGHMASILKPAYFVAFGVFLAAGLFFSALPARKQPAWFFAALAVVMGGIVAFALELGQGGLAVIEDAMMRPNAVACLLSVGLFGLIPLYWMVRWLKHVAPTDPVMAGMSAGAISGALAAAAYGVHCEQDAIAYVGIWYVLPIIAHIGIGGLLGHKLLRW